MKKNNHIRLLILVLCWGIIGGGLFAQQDTLLPMDTIALSDTISMIAVDSNVIVMDSLVKDSSVVELDVDYSKDALDAKVEYDARDSIVYDIVNKKIYLYGEASVAYTTLSLKADFIIFDWEKNEVVAEHTKDEKGQKVGVPAFQDGDQAFSADRMRYNFLTRKGIIYDVTSTYNDLYVLGTKAKFISKDADTLEVNDYVYSQNALITTCDHPEPHYGIRSKKQKVVPNKVVVVGPSNLEIMGVPTPLWLPFGFFPVTRDRKQGLLFGDYEFSDRFGFGLRDFGYYLPINEYMDLQATADMYFFTNTYNVYLNSRYKKRYRYNGSVRVSYTNQLVGETDEARPIREQAFSINWTHNQDSKSNPYNNLSGNINIQTNGFQGRTQNDAFAQLNNSLSSSVRYQRYFPNTPLNLSASMAHSQNTRTGRMTISLPTIDFGTQTLYPFKRKKRKGAEKWYEQITFRYKNQFKNQFETSDTTLFSQQTLDDARYGMRQNMDATTSFKLLKYFSINPNISYSEVWYMETLEKQFAGFDENDNAIIEDVDNFGFARYHQLSTGASLNTQLFGTWQSSKGWLRGVRHVMKPSVSMNYTPSNQNPNLGYRDTLLYTDIDGNLVEEDYSIFEGAIYGAPSNAGKSMSLGYGIVNNFEAKYFSKKDSTEHKFSLFETLRVSGNYNFAADSLRHSRVSVSGTTRLFNKITTLNINASFDPYNVNEDGRRIESFYWDTDKKLLRFEGATARLNSRISVSKLREMFANGIGNTSSNSSNQSAKKAQKKDDLLSLFERFTINHVFAVEWDVINEVDTFFVQTHTISTRGNIDLTDKWSITVGNVGYDFKSKGLSYPDFGFVRSLHCWQMGINTQPTRGTYQFYIRVNPSTSLNFLNVPWTKNQVDRRTRF